MLGLKSLSMRFVCFPFRIEQHLYKVAARTSQILLSNNQFSANAALVLQGYTVYALDVTVGDKLRALEGPSCKIAQVDVTSVESIQAFKKSFGDQKLDVLLNVAGKFFHGKTYILCAAADFGAPQGIMPTKEKDNLTDLTLSVMQSTFAINAYGPVLLTQALVDNVIASDGPRHIAVMSSRVGSIADNTSGGYLAYRASKTAANSFFKTIALDLQDKKVVVSMLHPGFTKTNLDPDIWKIPGVVEPEEAASKLWQLLKSKTMDDTGKFWHRDGMELPWQAGRRKATKQDNWNRLVLEK